jgi:adenylate cyclase
MLVTPFILLLVFAALLYFNTLVAVENLVYDNFLQSEREVADNIIIVGIEERSLSQIGTWPWPRFYMADAIDKLLDLGAAAIGIDVLYTEPGADPEYDQRLVEAASVPKARDRVVFGTYGVFGEERQDVLRVDQYNSLFDELAAVANTGFINVIPDEDGVMRKAVKTIRFGETEISSFPIEVYKAYRRTLGLEEDIQIPTNRFGQYNIDFAAKSDSYTLVSLWGVINDEYPPSLFENAIILVGPYALGMGLASDIYFTPIDRHVRTYGVEIHANTIQNLMENNFKREIAWYYNFITLVIFSVLSAVLFRRLGAVRALGLFIVMMAVQLIAARVLYDSFGLIVTGAYTLIFLMVAYLCQLVLSVLHAQHEKAHIRGLFGRFVAEEVVNEIITGNVSVELGGVLRDVTVLFVDIRGFTAFSETNPPEKVVTMVNRYLNLTSKSIQKYGGTIDKYIGDATMAIFNAPNDLKDHALCGVKAAWAMRQGAAELQIEILESFGVELQFGIGVNTGQAVVGNMGSDFRMDYTVIGDTVNTAARLEANAGKGQIVISDAVYQLVKEHVEVNDLGTLMVKNKKDGIHAYEVVNVRE